MKRSAPNPYERLMSGPFAYSLPHKWGHFSVTPAADAAYEILPLTANIARGGIDRKNLEPKAVEIILVSPEEDYFWGTEAKNLPESTPGTTSRLHVSSPYITAKKGIQIACSFEKTRQDMIEAELGKHAALHGVSVEELENYYGTPEGTPPQEHIGHMTTATLVRNLRPILMASLAEGHVKRSIMPRLFYVSAIKASCDTIGIAEDVYSALSPEHFDQQFEQLLDAS